MTIQHASLLPGESPMVTESANDAELGDLLRDAAERGIA